LRRATMDTTGRRLLMATTTLHQPTGSAARYDTLADGRPSAQTRLLYRVGFWAAVVAFAGAVGYMLSAFLQVLHMVSDRTDAVIAFAASLLIPVPFLLAMLVLHHTVPAAQRFWTHTAICFAVIYTTYNALNYVVQLATVIPAGYTWNFDNQQGTQGPLSLLNQTPHSLFWDVDALGYIFLSLATLAASPIFENPGLERWVRRFFLANGLIIPLFCVTYFWPGYSAPQLMFGLPWGITTPGSLFVLAAFYRRKLAPAQSAIG
jgi:hypothetical protein